MVIELKKFKPREMMGPEDISLFIGKRKTGKSTCMLDILYNYRRVPDGIGFCGSTGSVELFSGPVPETYIYEEWNDEIVKKMVKRSQRVNYDRKRQGLPKKYSFFFADDFAYDKSFCNNPQLKRLLMNGRNDGISPIAVALQYALNFKPEMRGQFDWIFIFREPNLPYRKRLYDHYCGLLPSFKVFCQIMDSLPKHGCLVARNCGTSNEIEDNFFWYKAKLRDWRVNPEQPKWHMGGRAYWKYHFENYDPKWRENEWASSGEESMPRQKRPRHNVRLK